MLMTEAGSEKKKWVYLSFFKKNEFTIMPKCGTKF